MTEELGQDPYYVPMADRTAIIVAGVAIGVSLFAAPGLYGPTNILIGLALIVTLHAADSQKDKNRFQSASFALAWALAFLLIAGLFIVNPYIHLFTDKGEPVTDHFAFIEFPRFPWFENTFQDQASDLVSFGIVSIVAVIWYMIRRQRFAVHDAPMQQEESVSVFLKRSSPSAPPPILAGVPGLFRRLEDEMDEVSTSTYQTPQTIQSATKQDSRMPTSGMVPLSIFMATIALFVYISSFRRLKHR